jgi:hypothetical protein
LITFNNWFLLELAHDAVSGGQLQQWEGLNMGSLLPGALLSCKVRQVSNVLHFVLYCYDLL